MLWAPIFRVLRFPLSPSTAGCAYVHAARVGLCACVRASVRASVREKGVQRVLKEEWCVLVRAPSPTAEGGRGWREKRAERERGGERGRGRGDQDRALFPFSLPAPCSSVLRPHCRLARFPFAPTCAFQARVEGSQANNNTPMMALSRASVFALP